VIEEHPGGGAEAGIGTWLPPVEMPPQTYQWNLRAVVDDPADPASAATSPAPPTHVGMPPSPAGPPVHAPAAPQPQHVHPGHWAASSATVRMGQRSVGGLTAACVVALLLPGALAFGVEGLPWHHERGVDWILVVLVGGVVAIGSLLIGLLASELGRYRTLPRALSAVALSSVTTLLLAALIDAHPVKFGFHLGASAYVALAGPVLAFAVSVGRPLSR
jgi:hypothetical protein